MVFLFFAINVSTEKSDSFESITYLKCSHSNSFGNYTKSYAISFTFSVISLPNFNGNSNFQHCGYVLHLTVVNNFFLAKTLEKKISVKSVIKAMEYVILSKQWWAKKKVGWMKYWREESNLHFYSKWPSFTCWFIFHVYFYAMLSLTCVVFFSCFCMTLFK